MSNEMQKPRPPKQHVHEVQGSVRVADAVNMRIIIALQLYPGKQSPVMEHTYTRFDFPLIPVMDIIINSAEHLVPLLK